ncbi:NAD(P)/FAD-dependent oxidoreductase [Pirellulales bacterium]|nr:NAD(P)/FAD-dependent oxidoreductase [Pirellulales bacterium]
MSELTDRREYDCVVMGGGPAGSTAAALIAEAGLSTLLVERERMPRVHIGESLMPEAYWTFERLGVLDKLQKSPFSRKVGVQFVNYTGKESQPFFFRSHDDRESSETWHVDRAEFDQMLFENAAEKGAECRDGVRVLEVVMEGDRARGVRLQSDGREGRTTVEVAAQVVVDATGQQALLGTRLGLRQVNPDLRKASIWQHFRGGKRDEQGGGVKTIILHTRDQNAWFWYIPQADDLVSVGVVGDRDYLLRDRVSVEQTFHEELAKCPGVVERLRNAVPIDELAVAKEFSYVTKRAAGEGWVLAGDAWGFIDPVYSSGVYFALKSAELAADAVVDGLRAGDVSAEALGRWIPEFSRQTNLIRKLVSAFYSKSFRVGKFLAEYPQHQDELVDLLIGRIFDGREGRIFDDLEPWLEAAEA